MFYWNPKLPVNVEGIVCIHDKVPRVRWKMEKVNKLLTGKDGVVTAAQLTLWISLNVYCKPEDLYRNCTL